MTATSDIDTGYVRTFRRFATYLEQLAGQSQRDAVIKELRELSMTGQAPKGQTGGWKFDREEVCTERLDRRREGLEEDYREALIAALKVKGATTWVALHANHARELTEKARGACASAAQASRLKLQIKIARVNMGKKLGPRRRSVNHPIRAASFSNPARSGPDPIMTRRVSTRCFSAAIETACPLRSISAPTLTRSAPETASFAFAADLSRT